MSTLFALATIIISGYICAFLFKVFLNVSVILWALIPFIIVVVLILLLFA